MKLKNVLFLMSAMLVLTLNSFGQTNVTITDTLEYKEVTIGSLYSDYAYYIKTDNADGTKTQFNKVKELVPYTSKMLALKQYTDAGWQIQQVFTILNDDTKLGAQILGKLYEVYLLKRKMVKK